MTEDEAERLRRLAAGQDTGGFYGAAWRPQAAAGAGREGTGVRSLAALGLATALCGAAHADTLRPLKGGWQRYANERFGTKADIPPGFDLYGAPPDNGDGREFRGADGARLIVSGSHLPLAVSAKMGAEDIEQAGTSRLYSARGKGWVVHSARMGSLIGYRKAVTGCGATQSIVFQYPADAKRAYDPIVTRVARSLGCGRG